MAVLPRAQACIGSKNGAHTSARGEGLWSYAPVVAVTTSQEIT